MGWLLPGLHGFRSCGKTLYPIIYTDLLVVCGRCRCMYFQQLVLGADLVYSMSQVAPLRAVLATIFKIGTYGEPGGVFTPPSMMLAHKRRHQDIDDALLHMLVRCCKDLLCWTVHGLLFCARILLTVEICFWHGTRAASPACTFVLSFVC